MINRYVTKLINWWLKLRGYGQYPIVDPNSTPAKCYRCRKTVTYGEVMNCQIKQCPVTPIPF